MWLKQEGGGPCRVLFLVSPLIASRCQSSLGCLFQHNVQQSSPRPWHLLPFASALPSFLPLLCWCSWLLASLHPSLPPSLFSWPESQRKAGRWAATQTTSWANKGPVYSVSKTKGQSFSFTLQCLSLLKKTKRKEQRKCKGAAPGAGSPSFAPASFLCAGILFSPPSPVIIWPP